MGMDNDHVMDEELDHVNPPLPGTSGNYLYTPEDVEARRRARMSELDRVRYDLGFDSF